MKKLESRIAIGLFFTFMVIAIAIVAQRENKQNAIRAERQYQERQAAALASAGPVYPIEVQKGLSKTEWITIEPKSWEHFVGDVIERDVVLENVVDNNYSSPMLIPDKNSGLNRLRNLGECTSLKIRIATSSPSDIGTYKYTLTRK